MRSHRKGQPHIHAAGVMFYGCVQELTDLRESDNFLKLALDLLPPHAQNGSIQEHVFAARQLVMEARAHFEQRSYSSADKSLAASRRRNPRENLEQRTLPGA